MRLLHLYRPRLPGLRAQAIQVVHTCHALACAGFEVTLLADRSGPESVADALAMLGLKPHPKLDLRLAPSGHPPTAGLWFRAAVLRWWAGAPGTVLARDKRRLLRTLGNLPHRHRIVLETHELDSALASERGESPDTFTEQEHGCLALADALVANCGGTLAAWQAAYGDRLPTQLAAIHNATAPDRARAHQPPELPVVRYVGSLRAYKGLAEVLESATDLPARLELIGGTPEERESIPSNIDALPPVPYDLVPDLLAGSSALLLPLSNNLFGRQLSSPLKLWDYLATQTPIVAADLPSIQEILTLTGAQAHLYTPGDAQTLVDAIARALASTARQAVLRTWADRARELAPLLRGSP